MKIGGINKMEEKLKALIKKYEGYLASDEDKHLDEYENGERNELLAGVQDLKEILGEN